MSRSCSNSGTCRVTDKEHEHSIWNSHWTQNTQIKTNNIHKMGDNGKHKFHHPCITFVFRTIDLKLKVHRLHSDDQQFHQFQQQQQTTTSHLT